VLWALLSLGAAFAGADEPAEAPVATPLEDEPELEGEEKRRHEREVKALVKELQDEPNGSLVLSRIERLAAEPTRVVRDALIAFARGNKNQEQISKSFLSLAKVGGKVAIEFLCGNDALRARDFLVAQSAANALAEAKDDRATGPLLDVMTDRRTKIEVVGACAIALGKSAPADERVVEALFEYASHRKDTIRSYALEALGFLATDEALARLVEALATDANTRARASAATGMKNSGRAECIPHLERALAEDKALTVKDACSEALRVLRGG
jgi:HEAT repeat protein